MWNLFGFLVIVKDGVCGSRWNSSKLVRVAHPPRTQTIVCKQTALKAKCLDRMWSDFTWILWRAGAPLCSPPSHLKVAIVVFVKKFSSTEEARRSASQAFGILKLNKRPFTPPLTTHSDSWLDHVSTCSLFSVCTWKERAKVLDGWLEESKSHKLRAKKVSPEIESELLWEHRTISGLPVNAKCPL